MAKWSSEQVRQTWEANGKDFKKSQTVLGISRASLYRHLAAVRLEGEASCANPQISPAPVGGTKFVPHKRPKKGIGCSWNIYLPNDLAWIRRRLEENAKVERRSVGEMVLMILEEHLKREEVPQKPAPRPNEEPAWLNEGIPGKQGQE